MNVWESGNAGLTAGNVVLLAVRIAQSLAPAARPRAIRPAPVADPEAAEVPMRPLRAAR